MGSIKFLKNILFYKFNELLIYHIGPIQKYYLIKIINFSKFFFGNLISQSYIIYNGGIMLEPQHTCDVAFNSLFSHFIQTFKNIKFFSEDIVCPSCSPRNLHSIRL